MLISRTPFRISFFGGGTDYPIWYKEHGGAVISTSIDKYCFIMCRDLPPFFEFSYRIRYYLKEEVKTLEEIQHPSVRECLRFMKYKSGIEMVHYADLPAQSGLGSSSSFTVGMLHAIQALQNRMPTKRELALNAIHIEQENIGEAVGSQDQTIAAFGGFNRIDFGGRKEITVQSITMNDERFVDLQDHLLLVYSGLSRNANEIASELIKKTPERQFELSQMMTLLEEAQKVLLSAEQSLEEFGRLLHEQWMLKRSMNDHISNSYIDDIYEKAIKSGATGGKLCGAGNGGFMLFFVKPEIKPQVIKALDGLLEVPFHFEDMGSQIIYLSRN